MKQCWILCCLYLTVGCVYSQHGYYNERGAAADAAAASGYDWRSNGDDLLEKFRRHYWADKQQHQQVNYHWRNAGGPQQLQQQPYYQATQANTYGGARWRQDRPNKVTEEEEIDALTAVAKSDKEPKVLSLSSSSSTQLPIATFKVKSRAEARQVASALQQQEGGHLIHTPTNPHQGVSSGGGVYFIALVAGCSAATVCGIIAAGFCWYKFQKNAKAAAEAEYPAYGVTGPNKDHVSPSGGGDRKLAHSAQMYHYQHQKQQMIAMEKTSGERQVSTSDLDSEDENEDGDYTVYECPGLAPTGEMEVKNPLFQDDPSVPSSPPVLTKPGDGPRPEQTGF